MKFQSKPTIIDAEQFRSGQPLVKGACLCDIAKDAHGEAVPHVHTIHANQPVRLEDGDWVVAEPDGIHYYPIKPSFFMAKYEEIQ